MKERERIERKAYLARVGRGAMEQEEEGRETDDTSYSPVQVKTSYMKAGQRERLEMKEV